ncbi:MAG TPA: aldolase/citrate lyase family protein, partial [bacterium]|nr:aldolase/citrate lyase family protein [bacterium]
YIAQANREIFVVAQIEDVEALDTLDDIAATPGIDILFLGAQDLSQSMGIPCQFDHPRIVQARKRVAEAARKYNKWWGCPAGVEKAEILYKEEGAQFFAGCAAIWFVLDGLKQVRAEFTKRLGD